MGVQPATTQRRAMAKGYVVVIEEVHDEEGIAAYAQAAAPAIIESSAEVLAFDLQPAVLEGEVNGQRAVILEFESVQAAQEWYDSAAYEAAIHLRQAAARSTVMIVSGVPSSAPVQG